jgi:hypothetical protein
MAFFLNQSSTGTGNDFKKKVLEMVSIRMVISSVWPDIRLFSVSGI